MRTGQGTLVTLKSFLGTMASGEAADSKENYWKLIGEKGRVVEVDPNDGKALVLFINGLDDFNLENHNPIKDTLWIRESDLEAEEI